MDDQELRERLERIEGMTIELHKKVFPEQYEEKKEEEKQEGTI